jgi:hypothetical protein
VALASLEKPLEQVVQALAAMVLSATPQVRQQVLQIVGLAVEADVLVGMDRLEL